MAGIMLVTMPLRGSANTPPSFVNGSPQSLTVCMNSSNASIDALLAINDLDAGDNETYTVISGPANGMVMGFPGFVTSNGSTVTPSGFSYMPNAGFSGSDVFIVQVADGAGGFATTTINVAVLAPPSLTLGANPSVCQGSSTATLAFTGLTNVGPISTIFSYTGASETWTVPAGITSLTFDVIGASGGSDNYSGVPNPGNGGRVQGMLNVSAGQQLSINVGGMGGNGSIFGAIGGYNGGGNAYFYSIGCGGAGGGASDIRIGGITPANRVIVAGGGAGNGWDVGGALFGGSAGGLIGADGDVNGGGTRAMGGTQVSGGAGATYLGWMPGGNGAFFQGGDGSTQGISGGGGGGYYGGGGGVWTGGGGGSSYTDPSLTTLVAHTPAYNIGNGSVSIQYMIAGTYSIDWSGDPAAVANGFSPESGVLPASSFTFAVPSGAATGTYNGVLTISNGPCTSTSYPISVTINDIPTVAPVSGQQVCNGASTSMVSFSGSVSGTVFNWTNSNTTIGLGASGTGDIPSFVVTNGTSATQTASITVTPSLGGCVGAPATFNILAEPTPMLNSSTTPPGICDSAMFNYIPTSATTGAVFTWTRDSVAGLTNATASGAGDPNEALINPGTAPVAAVYSYTVATFAGCSSTQNVTVNVNPKPTLTSATTLSDICDSTLLSYTPTSATSGTSFAWARTVTAGITNPANSGTGDPMEYLHNVAPAQVLVTYYYTLTANGCSNVQTVAVNVNARPTLTSSNVAPPICSGQTFNYTPTTGSAGATFSWTRNIVPGIAEGSRVGTADPNEPLHNTTANPITVTYEYIVTVGACPSNPQNVTVVVNPAPHLSSTLAPAAVCDSTLFTYVPASATPGAAISWTRYPVTGIRNGINIGTSTINETLVNTTQNPIVVPYVFDVSANGCSSVDSMKLTVNPYPGLTSTATPAAICDSITFKYTPTSNIPGATYAWSRPYMSGIGDLGASGSGNISDMLANTTYVNINVVYTYTVSANGCSGVPQTVTVTVHPTPKLSSPAFPAICSGAQFDYYPTSYVSGATFDWTRPAVPNLDPNTAFGTGNVHETLVNHTGNTIYTTYRYRVTANGCLNPRPQEVVVKVNPVPQGAVITGNYISSVCSNTMSQLFSAATPPASDEVYTWSADNATISLINPSKQYAYVNFPNSGWAAVTLTATRMGTGCVGKSTAVVNVGYNVADNPKVIYYQGQFVCLENNADSYQWGYDDISSFQSVTLDGQINQDYREPNADFANKRYWVMLTRNGCTQKAFYVAPQVPTTAHKNGSAQMRIYPNPVMGNMNIEVSNVDAGDLQFEVVNMMGQTVVTASSSQLKAIIDASGLTPGSYLINCFRDGNKLATSRFIKN